MKIEVGSTWVNKNDLDNTVTVDTVGSLAVTGHSDKDGSYMAHINDFLHYFKPLLGSQHESLSEMSEQEFESIIDEAFEEGYAQAYSEIKKSDQNLNYRMGFNGGYESGYKDAYEEIYCPNNERERALQEQAYDDGFKKGKEFNKDDQNLNYRTGYNDGWHDCEASFELGNEFTDSIQEQAYDEGYDQAIDDLIEAGVIGEEEYLDEDCSEEEYSEYEFGDVDDDEEEYCFSKELDKILNGEFTSSISFDGNKKDTSNLGEYNRGYEDGKSRGITLGYNKRDYEYSKPKNQSDNLMEGGEQESLMERKHSHYFKDVKHLDYIDIYQVCKLFEVNDQSHCTQHSIKKLLMSGKRGAKDKMKDIIEARDTLNRYLQIEGIE